METTSENNSNSFEMELDDHCSCVFIVNFEEILLILVSKKRTIISRFTCAFCRLRLTRFLALSES